MLNETQKPFVVDGVEEPTDVCVEHPAHLLPPHPSPQRIQRLMRATPRPEPVGEADEVLFVDRVENLGGRSLDDLVFQRGDPQGPLRPIRLRDENASRRLRPVRSPVNAAVEISEPFLHLLGVVLPRFSIDPRRGVSAQRQERIPKAIEVHVVKKRSEPNLPVLSCELTYTVQRTGHALLPALSPGRVLLIRVPLGQAPSLHLLRGRRSGVVRRFPRYYEPVRLPMSVHRRLATSVFPARPAPHHRDAGSHGISRFPFKKRPHMRRVSDRAGSRTHSPWRAPAVWPSRSLNTVGTPKE